jgi:hypothetical protein
MLGQTIGTRDPAFLEELARRRAERCGLPMRVARERVAQIVVSADLSAEVEPVE